MAYAVWAKQSGEGCDYTIGCANTLIMLGSSTDEDAIEEASEALINADMTVGSERELSRAIVVKIVAELDPKMLEAEEEDEDDEDDATEKRRRIYENLKKEFG